MENKLEETRRYWDAAAETFDEEADHGLRAPAVRRAWSALLERWMPAGKRAVLDIGCGTGSLSVLLAELGYEVTGIDLSPAMLIRAQAKARAQGYAIQFIVMDADAPRFTPGSFEAIVCRHLLWALSEPRKVLRRWTELLKPKGRLILIEGYWSAGGGLHADELMAMLPAPFSVLSILELSGRPEYWGKQVTDERYAILAQLSE
jgi:2-polyprenyl-3-methyl-5-hydroxy-6-metoxy-1,4-benzoquinol methylase